MMMREVTSCTSRAARSLQVRHWLQQGLRAADGETAASHAARKHVGVVPKQSTGIVRPAAGG